MSTKSQFYPLSIPDDSDIYRLYQDHGFIEDVIAALALSLPHVPADFPVSSAFLCNLIWDYHSRRHVLMGNVVGDLVRLGLIPLDAVEARGGLVHYVRNSKYINHY